MTLVKDDLVANHMIGKDPYDVPLENYDVSQRGLFRSNTMWGFFDRLRKEDPVHYCKESRFGPYWSVTKFKDIMEVEANPGIYSSEPNITIQDMPAGQEVSNFIAMDEPVHGDQRRTVQGVVAPRNLANMEGLIRERAGRILDSLPVGETFNWVDKVSIELTGQMLATLFGFPLEDRRKLTLWSECAIADPGASKPIPMAERQRILREECMPTFVKLWAERVNQPPQFDLISMMAHGENTKNMPYDRPMEFLGNLLLLIVGGNDTTRNSISGSILFLNQFPEQYRKLRENSALIETMVPEIIRFQTPLSHMRRIAKKDAILGGKQIKAGDKVVMWYVSGNRDDEVIDKPYEFIIDRERPRHHLAFGMGIHRCMGSRLAEMQLRVLWEEILKRFEKIDVVGDPVRTNSNIIKGYSQMPVRVYPL